MQFLVFAASHRPESHNKKLAQLAVKAVEEAGHKASFIDYGNLDMPIYDDHLASTQPLPNNTKRLLDMAENCDGMIIASPEYNWSMPGSLKNIVDWTSKADITGLANKTALLLAASPSNRGGIIGLTHLRSALESLQMHVFHKVFALENSHIAFNDQGQLDNASRKSQFEQILTDYVTYTHNLTNT